MEVSFPDEELLVNLPAGTRLQTVNANGEVNWLVLANAVRVRLVPEPGTVARFIDPGLSKRTPYNPEE